jgi:hypothetical protein
MQDVAKPLSEFPIRPNLHTALSCPQKGRGEAQHIGSYGVEYRTISPDVWVNAGATAVSSRASEDGDIGGRGCHEAWMEPKLLPYLYDAKQSLPDAFL